MAPPTAMRSARSISASSTPSLSETLAPPRKQTKGRAGVSAADEGVELFGEQVARGDDRHVGHHAGGRGVGAVGGAEGVVHVDVGERGEGLREGRFVLRLLAVEAEILEQQDLAGLQALDRGGDLRADAVARERDGYVQDRGQGLRYRCEGELRVRGILGPAEVGGEHDPRTGGDQALERRKRRPDAAVVADLAVLRSGTFRSARTNTRFPRSSVDASRASRDRIDTGWAPSCRGAGPRNVPALRYALKYST